MAKLRPWLFNRLASLLRAPSLQAADLLEIAAKQEGETDFGEPGFEPALEVLTRSLAEDARLSPIGRQALHGLLVRNLAMCLRLVADQRRRPEVYARPLTPPILILGMPRAGTTFLQRLLSAMPDARPARAWEINQPLAPARGEDQRFEQAVKQVTMMRRLAPELEHKHRIEPSEPDECVLLMGPSFRSISWWMIAPVYSYLDWLFEQDLRPSYAEYHAYLRALQAAEGGRFVLKAPAHTGYLAEIVAEIPDVVVVAAHRDPVTVIASASSLFDSMYSLVSEHHDSPRTARRNLELFAALTDRCQAARDSGLDERVLDVRYETLIADPIAAVRRIYEHGSIPWPEGGEAALRGFLGADGRRGGKRHDYSLERFGLREAEIRERFADYSRRYLG
ncbi:MAG: sulfotransferase [Enhygromyxa sp.]